MPDRKPNILLIRADDVGWFNVSCNNGVMGHRTANIDWISREGANFTDFYGQQSRTELNSLSPDRYVCPASPAVNGDRRPGQIGGAPHPLPLPAAPRFSLEGR